MPSRVALAFLAASLFPCGSVVAQTAVPDGSYLFEVRRPLRAELAVVRGVTGPGSGTRLPGEGHGNPDHAFLASLAVPGTGQYMLGQMRWVPYVIVETYGWIRFSERRSTARELADRYRDLAWTAARQASGGERRDTSFAYYEVLARSARSGAYDADPTATGLQPEPDPATYNGEQWRLARALFVPLGSEGTPGTPGYEAALAYYMEHAIPDGYTYAWTSDADRQRYRELIEDSDDAYGRSTVVLGLILANHLTSSIDALITARLRRGGRDLRFESGIMPDARGNGLDAPLRLDTGVRYSW